MMSYDIYQARRTVHNEKKAGTLINACGNSACKTVIFLDNGAVVSSPLTVNVIINSVERSNQKSNAKNSPRLKVYDVYDEEPSPENDEFEPEMSAFTDDIDDFDEDEEDFEDEDFDDE